jgi:RNA polymerase sigma-32 factor
MATLEPKKADGADRRFVSRAMSTAMLEAGHERDLAMRWRDGHDEQALHELTGAYMRLVIAMARRFRVYGLPNSDLIQEGAVGLMQAAARFEPSREVRFSTYAGWWIRAAMQDYILRNWSIVRTGTTSAQKSLFFNLRRLRAKMGDLEGGLNAAARAAIAIELDVPEGEVTQMASRLSAGDRSLNAPIGEDGAADWQDLLADERPLQDEEVMERLDGEARNAVLGRALSLLKPRELAIIQARRLSEEPETLEALGRTLGVSKERVRQLEQAALFKLKSAIEREVGNPAMAGLV